MSSSTRRTEHGTGILWAPKKVMKFIMTRNIEVATLVSADAALL